jgi:hypothetical protein
MKIFITRLAAALAPVTLLLGNAFTAAGVASAAAAGCAQGAPTVRVGNNWAWSAWGSWGLPGQQLTYLIDVGNTDVGCSPSSFVVTVSAPSGFSVSVPTSTVTLRSSATGYLRTNVASPSGVADGDYPITVTVTRAGAAGPASSFTSYYKVYSSDSTPPTLYWPSPGDGTTISGRSYNVAVSSSDDHMVKKIELFIDDALVSTADCDGIGYTCQLTYTWSLRGVRGQYTHTATFKAYDWKGNIGTLTTKFTVS